MTTNDQLIKECRATVKMCTTKAEQLLTEVEELRAEIARLRAERQREWTAPAKPPPNRPSDRR